MLNYFDWLHNLLTEKGWELPLESSNGAFYLLAVLQQPIQLLFWQLVTEKKLEILLFHNEKEDGEEPGICLLELCTWSGSGLEWKMDEIHQSKQGSLNKNVKFWHIIHVRLWIWIILCI